jgi:GT2 family glycosyltransferase
MVYVFESGTVAENMNRVLDRRTGKRWLVIMDDDILFLTPCWLDHMLFLMEKHQDIGLLVASELKTPEVLLEREKNPKAFAFRPRVNIINWCPGYLLLLDTERLDMDDLRVDEDIPGKSQMSDVDLSLQIQTQGFKCAMATHIFVDHPFNPDSKADTTGTKPNSPERRVIYEQQLEYMDKKWGRFFWDRYNYKVREVRE